MKILIIRHGDPIYEPVETLTEKGFQEIKALGEMYKDIQFSEAFVSDLPRAQLTAHAVLDQTGREATTCTWLREFYYKVKIPNRNEEVTNWDFLPSFFEKHPNFYNNKKYLKLPWYRRAKMKQKYDEVIKSFEEVLNRHGYYKKGDLFYTEKGNNDVLVFFCHLGVMGVLLSHLLNIPYIVFAQKFACPPTGVTTVYTEEREEGIVQFRCQSFGDVSHLRKAGQEPAFACRFCETFDSPDRH